MKKEYRKPEPRREEQELLPENVSGESNSEQKRVIAWRTGQMKELGFSAEYSEKLALDPDVDLRIARQLIRDGCEPELAFKILSSQEQDAPDSPKETIAEESSKS